MMSERRLGSVLLKLLGIALVVVGVLALVVGLFGLDPNSKQSDDSDPFGSGPSAAERIMPFAVAVLCFGGVFWLIRVTERRDSGTSIGRKP